MQSGIAHGKATPPLALPLDIQDIQADNPGLDKRCSACLQSDLNTTGLFSYHAALLRRKEPGQKNLEQVKSGRLPNRNVHANQSQRTVKAGFSGISNRTMPGE
ncbi:MAG: hypothetical protein H7833_00210 [Magnetococcus sp. DMHC-1]|nr:hypothetical protein [Magnetococcales bacterium]